MNHLGIRSADEDAAVEAVAVVEAVEPVAVEPLVAFRVLEPAKFAMGAVLQEFRIGQILDDPWAIGLARDHGVRLEECEAPPTPDEVAALDTAEAVEIVADRPRPYMIGSSMVVLTPGQVIVDQWQIRLYREAGVEMRACPKPPAPRPRGIEVAPLPPAAPRFDAPKAATIPSEADAKVMVRDYPQIIDVWREKCSRLCDQMQASGCFPSGKVSLIYSTGRFRASEARDPAIMLIEVARLFNRLVDLAGEARDPASLRFQAEQNAIAAQASAAAANAASMVPAFNPNSTIQLWASRGWNLGVRNDGSETGRLTLERVGVLTDADRAILADKAKVEAIKNVIRNTIEV